MENIKINNKESNKNNINDNEIMPRTYYTLQGSQPYVLTYEWPIGFVKCYSEFKQDNSLNNIEAYNLSHKYATYNTTK